MVSDEKSTVIPIFVLLQNSPNSCFLWDFLFAFWSMDIIYLAISFGVYPDWCFLSFLELRFWTIKSFLLQIFLLFHSLFFILLIFQFYMCFTFRNHARLIGCSGVILVVGFFSTKSSLLMRPSEKFISFSVLMISSISFWLFLYFLSLCLWCPSVLACCLLFLLEP